MLSNANKKQLYNVVPENESIHEGAGVCGAIKKKDPKMAVDDKKVQVELAAIYQGVRA